jgi:ABC-type Mn2+/Zn2+ transport system permease subunit
VALGRAWTAISFDPDGAPALGLPVGRAELALLASVAAAVVAAIPAVGALLVTSVFVVPAAAARLVTGSVRGLLAAAVALAAGEAVVGLYVSVWTDVPPGPAVAVLGAGVYGLVAVGA